MHRSGIAFALFAAGLLLSLSGVAQAEPSGQKGLDSKTFGIGLGYLTGNTLYHISSYDTAGNGIESELEFPLNTMLLGLEGGYVGRNDQGREALKVTVQWFTSIGSGSGKLKDSDWLSDSVDITEVGSVHPGLDIYSESDIDLNANIVDLQASYNFWASDGFAVGPLGGLLYQYFEFDASNVHQVGFGPYAPGYTGSVSGLVLTYEVTYVVPYIGIHSEMVVSRGFEASVDLGYSPWASAEDKDDHVLRKKVAQASTTGKAYLAGAAVKWDFQENDRFVVGLQYLKIDTSGTQSQTFYDGSGLQFTGINDKIESQQTTVTFLYSHRF